MKAYFKITYFLWKARANDAGEIPLYIISSQNSAKQIPYNTGLRFTKDQWNKKKNQPFDKPSELMELETRLTTAYKELAAEGVAPTLTDLLERKKGKPKVTGSNVITWCDEFISSGKYSEGKVKGVKTLRSNIKEWSPRATIQNFNFEGFISYLTTKTPGKKLKEGNEKKTGRVGIANNSQAKRLNSLRLVAKHAKLELPKFEFEAKTGNAEKIRIEYKEVLEVIEAEAKTPLEVMAKEVFLLACFSGLRISDMLGLSEGTLHGSYYEKVMDKTIKRVMVTLHVDNEYLFKKYIENPIPHKRQTLSDNLKQVLKRCPSFDRKVVKIKIIGEKPVKEEMKLWEAVAFHAGRNFYARLLSDLGLSNEIIADELGHTHRTVTQDYIGSQEHRLRIVRVRRALANRESIMVDLEKLMNEEV